ncbi:MAG TPA: P-type conjugative transfer protein TrbL [Burkholderiales bacterium]|nr:P-type conjugative transfer protein TrbL [Burkholderiales bacterium]
MWSILLAVASFFLLDVVYAAPGVTIGSVTGPSFTLLDPFVDAANAKGDDWRGKLAALGENTFFLLATLELAWAACLWALEKDEMSSFTADLIKKLMYIGFFFLLLDKGPEWIPIVVKSFEYAGEHATSAPPLTVDGVIATGLAIIALVWSKAPTGFDVLGKLGEVCVALIATLVIAVAYFVAAAQLLCLRIEAFLLLAAGAIFLCFGGSSWTNEYVTKYFKYALTVGLRLLVILVILGMTTNLVMEMGDKFVFEYMELFQIMGVAVVTVLLSIRAPEMASALMSGGIGFSGGTMVSSAQSVGQGMKTAGGIAAMPGRAAAAVGQAGYHAFKLAQNSRKLGAATGQNSAGVFAKALGGQMARTAMNAARGQGGSAGFKAGGKDGDPKNPMGTGSSKKPGTADRANRDVKAKLAAAEGKKGGSVEGS